MSTSTPTVFIVDDQQPVRDALGGMLRVFGYEVETHPSAEHFLEKLTGERHGCVVADVRMPGMDGIDLVRELAKIHIADGSDLGSRGRSDGGCGNQVGGRGLHRKTHR